ncbi:glycosyltransferase family 4 protein [Chryseomicrobium palamuruense]|uniref:Glycosyltransferase family 4 protein n=1 Tax=Chryseomicrobium palamuruense TaxID=682973 RepID=A0ABV8UXD1_9BACL
MILHIISGGETGGSKNHLLSLLQELPKDQVELAVLQEGRLAEEARAFGITVHSFQQSSRYDVSAIQKLKKLIEAKHVKIVHSHGPRANLFVFFVKKMTKFYWMTTIHSDPTLDFVKGGIKGRVFTALNRSVFSSIDHFFAVSERFKQMLVTLGIPAEKISVIYNGIDFTTPDSPNITRTELGVEEESFVITMVARLHPIKNYPDAFELIRKLREKGHSVELLAVGDGPLKEDLHQQVKAYEGIHFLGFRTDVDAVLRQSDCLLLASTSESFPLVLLEAAKAKIPVLTTDVGGVRELIQSDEMGAVVPVHGIDEMVLEIERLIGRKAQGVLSEGGQALYEHASNHYSVTQLAKATWHTYQQHME